MQRLTTTICPKFPLKTTNIIWTLNGRECGRRSLIFNICSRRIVQRFGENVRSKSTAVVNVHIKPNNDNKIIYTAHSSGDMCFWDLRKSKCESKIVFRFEICFGNFIFCLSIILMFARIGNRYSIVFKLKYIECNFNQTKKDMNRTDDVLLQT